jgi:hypothetical protein
MKAPVYCAAPQPFEVPEDANTLTVGSPSISARRDVWRKSR